MVVSYYKLILQLKLKKIGWSQAHFKCLWTRQVDDPFSFYNRFDCMAQTFFDSPSVAILFLLKVMMAALAAAAVGDSAAGD